MNAFKNLAPYIAFFLGGYFVFIKLPFLFLRKSMDVQKKKIQEEKQNLKISEPKYTVEDYEAFKQRLKLMNGESGPKQKQQEQKQQKQERSKQERPKQEEKKKPQEPKRPAVSGKMLSPEEILGFGANEVLTQSSLKKRYFELLKQNHPDRVASMGEDFKKLAEKNTKDINSAYEKLKKKAA